MKFTGPTDRMEWSTVAHLTNTFDPDASLASAVGDLWDREWRAFCSLRDRTVYVQVLTSMGREAWAA